MMNHPALAGLPLVLGGNVFGWTADKNTSFAVLDAFYEAGGRMIDTADVYSAWADGHKGGESELVLGEWLESRGVRKDMRIHTKTGMLGDKELYEPARVLQSLDASLERLRTDYVDLYYAHRDYEELTPDAIVSAFDGAAKSKKVTSLGASNFSAERLKAMLDTATELGAAPFSVLQNEYNLVSRDGFGPDLQDLCKTHSIPMLPYFGLAAGFLTGKYRKPEDFEEGARGSGVKKFQEKGANVLKAMDAIADETGASHAAIALAWLREQPAIGAPIASARKPEQLTDLIASTKLDLNDAQIGRLSDAL
ncbi:aldo/keto reductase [Porphyrobacter algicida]|uniref:Aldo/keto reductase n=1 Tax=Qipengyuania algicida TaxID=1836209 RepID=A0A845AI86_9SPHN|nr:aldo/keto reductase [Qipengyuania algicida]MXP28893.1 aldo/keto reductase [Qipengyuania algicida]